MSILLVILSIALAISLLPGLYLFTLTVIGLFDRSSRRGKVTPSSRFAILVPAHNEEIVLPKLLENLEGVEYPRDMYDIYVVADNCTDATAEIGRQHGAMVFERRNQELRGKGYALQWLLEQIRGQSQDYDAYVFIDADSIVSPNFLAVMDDRLQHGSDAVQSYYTVSNPTQSPVASLRYIALVLMHYVRPRGRRVLGLSCGLFGTGMAFRKALIDEHGWDAFTLAEDVEYYLKLIERGGRVDFAPQAILWSDMPTSYKDAKTQNLRWERGRLQMAWKYGVRFFLEGLFRLKPVKMDAGIEQLIPPISLVFLAAFLLFVLSLFTGRMWLMGIGLAANLTLLGHIFLGLLSAKAPLKVYGALIVAPRFILWKLWVYILAIAPGKMSWTRTERTRH